jgi:ubiquinone biosynthesis monooxygenase Coq7
MMTRRGVRPTLLAPIWDRAGFALGAITAALGPEAAMACTAAIETEIDRHYEEQLETMGDADPELADAVREFQAEEVEHRDIALAAGAEAAPAYPLLSGLIRLGCRTAIALSKRI